MCLLEFPRKQPCCDTTGTIINLYTEHRNSRKNPFFSAQEMSLEQDNVELYHSTYVKIKRKTSSNTFIFKQMATSRCLLLFYLFNEALG